MSEVLWRPPPERAERSLLRRFAESAPGSPGDYHELWQWSVTDLPAFWEKVWLDCGVRAERAYDEVMGPPRMPGTAWFTGATLNFAENLLRRTDEGTVLISAGEQRAEVTVSAAELRELVSRAERGLQRLGVEPGDRVAALAPNTVETVVCMLAATALGAVWSSCSPDFGPLGVVDRFGQIRPKVLVACDGYRYNGTVYPVAEKLDAALEEIAGVEHVVTLESVGCGLTVDPRHGVEVTDYDALLGDAEDAEPWFVALPFDHPVYIMYSSGTTGPPKSIVHGAGGTLLKHLSEHQLQTDLQAGRDVAFWFTTTGWMMWNWLVGALASGVTAVLYEGSPTAPDLGALWRLAERTGITHFGTSPKFLAANAQAGLRPAEAADLSQVRWLLSTGAPLAPEQFDWVYANVGDDLQLASISGGTDLLGCFAAGVPTLPVRRGELQGRALGMAVEAWDERGRAVTGERGELVCTAPFPSMPVGFWNDPDGSRYHEAYFARFPGVWTHGDFIEIRPHGGVVIYGRSDTTLNPGGVRIGTAEIYRAIEQLPEIADSVVVGRPADSDVEVVLCVCLAEGAELDEALAARLRETIRAETTPRHVPRHIFAVREVPYTLSGKKVEKAVQAVLAGEEVPNRDALANPDALDEYTGLLRR